MKTLVAVLLAVVTHAAFADSTQTPTPISAYYLRCRGFDVNNKDMYMRLTATPTSTRIEIYDEKIQKINDLSDSTPLNLDAVLNTHYLQHDGADGLNLVLVGESLGQISGRSCNTVYVNGALEIPKAKALYRMRCEGTLY